MTDLTNLECSVCHYKRWYLSEGRAFVEHVKRNEVTGEFNLFGDLICYACLPDIAAAGVFNELDEGSQVTERRGRPQRKDQRGDKETPIEGLSAESFNTQGEQYNADPRS